MRHRTDHHPFGDRVSQHLSRKHGLTQNRLAECADIDPTVLSRMCKRGERLVRDRVLSIIECFIGWEVLSFTDEANDLLEAAGMARLKLDNPKEKALLEQLKVQPKNEEAKEDSNQDETILTSSPLPPCPYRGLYAFREQDAPFFFGRETFTADLAEVVDKQSLVAVLGPSGSGKTSTVFAGLLPHLRTQGNWLTATFRPGNGPFKSLAGALLPLYETGLDNTDLMVQTQKLAQYLREGTLSLTEGHHECRQQTLGPISQSAVLPFSPHRRPI